MPSQKNVSQLSEIREQLATAQSVVLSTYAGLSVAQQTKLRREVKEAGGTFGVAKNNLLKIAIKEHFPDGLPQEFEKALEGPTAVLIAQTDAVSPLKVLVTFAKDNEKPELKLGYMDGKVLSVSDIKQLSLLPGRNELLAKLIGQLNAPISGFVNVLSGTLKSLVYVINAVKEQKEKISN